MAHIGYDIIDSFVVDGLVNQRVQFNVPLDYNDASNHTKITICVNITQKFNRELHRFYKEEVVFPVKANVLAYLQGGPGFPCGVPVSNSGYPKVLIDKGYQLVFYDQRGTGLSSPIEVGTLINMASSSEHSQKKAQPEVTEKLLQYVLNFRADSIVEDMEFVRGMLIGSSKWTLLGQSFGGFCTFTYLSRYPNSLKEVYITGGVPPVGFTAEDVYRQTFERTKERNVHYYQKYPQDVSRVKEIVQYLGEHRVELPNGGVLSIERFQQLGIRFGGAGGTDGLHILVTELWYSIRTLGRPTYSILNTIQNDSSFDTNILYALFQEAIYCDGANKTAQRKSNWAANRLRYEKGNENFVVNSDLISSQDPIYFTGEMVFKSMFEDYAELVPLKELAHALHEYEDWSELYNVEVLEDIEWEDVPIIATTYYSDQYVDFDITMKVKNHIFKSKGNTNLRQHITNEFFHNGLRANPSKVLNAMFALRDCDVD